MATEHRNRRCTLRFKRLAKKYSKRRFRRLLKKSCQPENEERITISTKVKNEACGYCSYDWD